jgi:hypothetical protein
MRTHAEGAPSCADARADAEAHLVLSASLHGIAPPASMHHCFLSSYTSTNVFNILFINDARIESARMKHKTTHAHDGSVCRRGELGALTTERRASLLAGERASTRSVWRGGRRSNIGR